MNSLSFALAGIKLAQVMVGQSLGLLISTAISDVFTAQSFSFVLVLGLMLFGERTSIYSIIQNFSIQYSVFSFCIQFLYSVFSIQFLYSVFSI